MCVRMVWGGVGCGKGVCRRAHVPVHWHSVVVMVEAAWCDGADGVVTLCCVEWCCVVRLL